MPPLNPFVYVVLWLVITMLSFLFSLPQLIVWLSIVMAALWLFIAARDLKRK